MYYRRITESWSQVLFLCDCYFVRRMSFNPFSAPSAEESCWIRAKTTKSIAIKVKVAVLVAHCCSFWPLCALMANVIYKRTVTFNWDLGLQCIYMPHSRPQLHLAPRSNDWQFVFFASARLSTWPCNPSNSVLLFSINRLATDCFSPRFSLLFMHAL